MARLQSDLLCFCVDFLKENVNDVTYLNDQDTKYSNVLCANKYPFDDPLLDIAVLVSTGFNFYIKLILLNENN